MSQLSAFDRGWAALTRVVGNQSSNATGNVTLQVLDGAGNVTASYSNISAVAGKETRERRNIGDGELWYVSRRFTLQLLTMPANVVIEKGYRIIDWDSVTYVIEEAEILAQKAWACDVYRKR